MCQPKPGLLVTLHFYNPVAVAERTKCMGMVAPVIGSSLHLGSWQYDVINRLYIFIPSMDFYTWILWIHKMDWRCLPCHFFWIYFSGSFLQLFCVMISHWLTVLKHKMLRLILYKSRWMGLVNIVHLWLSAYTPSHLSCYNCRISTPGEILCSIHESGEQPR